ncbi:hypothetical protein ACJX0J_015762, partial [Zea mays]
SLFMLICYLWTKFTESYDELKNSVILLNLLIPIIYSATCPFFFLLSPCQKKPRSVIFSIMHCPLFCNQRVVHIDVLGFLLLQSNKPHFCGN